jgi:hypothetical protein
MTLLRRWPITSLWVAACTVAAVIMQRFVR